MKDLYKVQLNWYGKMFMFYTHASGRRRALLNSAYKLARIVKTDARKVYCYFASDAKDNYLITKERRQ